MTCGSAGKESACNVGDLGSILGLGKSPGEGKGYPLQYSGLENSMDCTVHGVTKSWTRLMTFPFFSMTYQATSESTPGLFFSNDFMRYSTILMIMTPILQIKTLKLSTMSKFTQTDKSGQPQIRGGHCSLGCRRSHSLSRTLAMTLCVSFIAGVNLGAGTHVKGKTSKQGW